MARQRRCVYFSGDVQGVGFRYTACNVAGGHDVTGYVRNTSDGRVECVVEGEEARIDAFLGELKTAMGHYIDNISQEIGPFTGEFRSFGVRY